MTGLSNPQTRRTTLGFLAAALMLPQTALARAVSYRIDADRSRVGFGYLLGAVMQKGDMPVKSAKILIDPGDLAAARVDVTVNAARARTDLILAAGALKGRDMLDTDTYPDLRFVSKAVILSPSGRISDGARIDGSLTLRGVTRPISLSAELTRAAGSAPDDLNELTIRLGGQISRSAFGVSGYPDLVGDMVMLDIMATLVAQA